MEDIFWVGKVLKISETSLKELPQPKSLTYSHSETRYTYKNTYTFFGHKYQDSMSVFLQLLYPDYITNKQRS